MSSSSAKKSRATNTTKNPAASAVYIPEDAPWMDDFGMKGRDFEDATRTAIRAISTDFKGQVVFMGDGGESLAHGIAATNKETTILPSVAGKDLTRRQVEVGRGYATHEAMHKIFTPFDALQKTMQRWAEDKQRLTKTLHNAMEDIRIENGAAILVPGAPKHLDQVTSATCRHFVEEVLPSAGDPVELMKDRFAMMPVAVTWAGRIKMGYPNQQVRSAFAALDPAIQKEANDIADIALSIEHGATGPGVYDKAIAEAGGIELAKRAEELANEIADETDPANQSQGQGQGQGQGGQQKQPQQGNGNGSGSGGGPGGNGVQGGNQIDPFDPEVNDAARKVMSEGDDKAYSRSGAYRVLTTDADVLFHRKPRFGMTESDLEPSIHGPHVGDRYRYFIDPQGPSKYAKIQTELSSNTATIKRKLERAIMAQDRRGWRTNQRDGAVDTKRLPQIMAGSELVRKVRTERAFPSTAVSLLVDLSSSMSGGRIRLAQQTCIVLAEALARTPVKLEIAGFYGIYHAETLAQYWGGQGVKVDANGEALRDQNGNSVKLPIPRSSGYDRIDACVQYLFKHFNESFQDARHVMGNMASMACGGTPDADAIIYAVRRLMTQRVQRRILLVMADGGPGWTQDNGHTKSEEDQLRDSVEFAKVSGIECVGIGINANLSQFYPRHTSIKQIEDLPKGVVDGLARMLLGDRFKVDNADLLASNRERAKAAGNW